MADGRIHREVGEEIRDWLPGGGRGQRLTERLDVQVAQEGQASVPGSGGDPHKAHSTPSRLLNRRSSSRPFQGSNLEGEQSSIVLLPVALTLKVGREDSQAVLLPHPAPPPTPAWKSSVPDAGGGRGGQKSSLSLLWAHTEESHSGSIRSIGHTPPPTAAAPPIAPPACHWWLLWALDTPLRSTRQKGTVPFLLKEWRLLLEDYLSQPQPPSLPPFCRPFP